MIDHFVSFCLYHLGFQKKNLRENKNQVNRFGWVNFFFFFFFNIWVRLDWILRENKNPVQFENWSFVVDPNQTQIILHYKLRVFFFFFFFFYLSPALCLSAIFVPLKSVSLSLTLISRPSSFYQFVDASYPTSYGSSSSLSIPRTTSFSISTTTSTSSSMVGSLSLDSLCTIIN